MAPKPSWLTQNFAQWRQDRTWLTQVFRSHWLKWQQFFSSFQVKTLQWTISRRLVHIFFNRLIIILSIEINEWWRGSFWRIFKEGSKRCSERRWHRKDWHIWHFCIVIATVLKAVTIKLLLRNLRAKPVNDAQHLHVKATINIIHIACHCSIIESCQFDLSIHKFSNKSVNTANVSITGVNKPPPLNLQKKFCIVCLQNILSKPCSYVH